MNASSSTHDFTAHLPSSELTGRIIAAAIEVHTRLGPGFIESAYENALCIELDKRGISFTKQVEVSVMYDDIDVAVHRLDLLVEDEIVVELKATTKTDAVHFAQTRSYIQAAGLDVGLLLNFGQAPLGIRRVTPRA